MGHFPYDAVVFDLDGTLFDAEEGIVSSVVKAMKEMGLEIPQGAQLRQVVGPPLRYSFHDLLNVPSERLDEAADRYAHIFRSEGMYRYSVYPGIRTMLRVLKENGIYVALASSKPRDLCEHILRHYGLRHFFDRVIGETDSHAKLGKPEMIRRALPEHYERAAMVGDRLYDMEGAKAAGVDGVGAVYGCGSVEELQNAGATLLVSDADELRELLCPGAAVPRGFFLSMEGPDGCGKTTQANLLEKSLRQMGFELVRTREPGGCPISEKIRQIILDTENAEMCANCEALLYAASRAQHVHQVIRPAVEAGKVVLSDRFVDSSVAYQGGGRAMGVDMIRQINEPAVDGMLPDATVYLAIDHTTAMNRRLNASRPDRLEMESGAFHGRVQAAYEELIDRDRQRFIVVSGDQPVEEIARQVLRQVLKRLEPDCEQEA
ncbi:MAG: dTMP kinase [Clostridia bacterium]|nr:MAG: dTMP kinase [Clostridia bacterium]